MDYPGSNLSNFNPEILRLIKSGGGSLPSLNDYVKELRQPDYPMNFVAFMDQMIAERKMDRKTVIARAGLSESLGYKYLSGQKKTTERDYILALCIAMHLTLAQTQHALRCYGMPLLGNYDFRAVIIRLGIEQGLDIYQINEHLETAHFPLIRTSSDMPSAEIKDSFSEMGTPQMQETNPPAYQPMQYSDEEEYEIVESSARAFHCGLAPFDYNYFGSMTLKDDDGVTYHLRADYHTTGETYFVVMNDEQYEAFKVQEEEYESFDSGEVQYPSTEEEMIEYEEMLDQSAKESQEESDEQDVLELYFSLLDATASKFFPFFLKLDHLTDLKVAEVMAKVDDTRNYPYRVGCHLNGGKQEIYIEMFNSAQPERQEYFQMIENTDHECTYTASHESYFMQIEMNDLYGLYFTKKKKPEYFLQVTNGNFDELDKHYRMIFNMLRHYLHTSARDYHAIVTIPDEQFYSEESEFFAEQYVASIQSGNVALAKHALEDQEKAINASNISPAEKLLQLTINEQRKYYIAQDEQNTELSALLQKKIISKKEAALQYENSLGEDAPTLFTSIADIMLDKWRREQMTGAKDFLHQENLLEQILELMEHGAYPDKKHNASDRFEIFQAYAFAIDSTEPEEAEKYYLKAIKEARKYHLELDKKTAHAVSAVYNNYAWVLWNKLGSEEAIVYYGRAIELAESFLENGMLPPEEARNALAHYGHALLTVYMDAGKEKEYDRLHDHLTEIGVDLSTNED